MPNDMVILPVQFQKKMISTIDLFVNEGTYNSKAEFIREAVRKLIDYTQTQRLIFSLKMKQGMGKRMGKEPTAEEIEKARETAFKRSIKEIGWE